MARGTYLLTYAAIFVSALIVSRDGQAEGNSAKVREARTACLAGDYTQGVRLLSELFVSSKDPGFIYNQARCFEQNSRYQEAIGRFHEYLRAGKKLSAEEKADAEKHIADCKELLASEKPQAVPPPLASQPETEKATAAEKPLTTVHQTNPVAGSPGWRRGASPPRRLGAQCWSRESSSISSPIASPRISRRPTDTPRARSPTARPMQHLLG